MYYGGYQSMRFQKIKDFCNDSKLFKTFNYILCPMLFSIYPVIFLYTHNVEILHLNQLLFPLFIAFFLAITSFLLWKIVFKDGLKASFAATGFLILFWNYDLFYQGINYVLNLKHWHTVPLFLFIYGHLVFFLDLINKKLIWRK